MKAGKFIYFSALLFLISAVSSCKKQDVFTEDTAGQESTFDISTGQAIADNATEDVNGIFMEAAAAKNLLGNNTQAIATANTLNGALVTVTPAAGFPKTIVIDFGDGISANGSVRYGKINVVLSDSVRKTGSTAKITFVKYILNGYRQEGSVTWTNTSTAAAKGWQRKTENGKISTADGRFWLHSGLKEAVQIGGANTPNTLLDDIFLITGNHKVTNAAGKTKDAHITEALQKKAVCENIGTGKLKVVSGDGQDALIDFGNGECDKTATISINGGSPKTITLR
jgi:hypothetical protein